jgi:hypothetical protein
MPKIETWKSVPIENEILVTLIRNHGEMLTSDLLRSLESKYEDMTKEVLMDHLFRLEVRSYIQVVQIKKDVSKVEIARNARLTESLAAQLREFRH